MAGHVTQNTPSKKNVVDQVGERLVKLELLIYGVVGVAVRIILRFVLYLITFPLRVLIGILRFVFGNPIWMQEFFLFNARRRPVLNFPPEDRLPAPPDDLLSESYKGWIAKLESRITSKDSKTGQSHSDFILQADLEKHPAGKIGILKKDIDDLNRELLPVYLEHDYRAKRYQNIYYHYQWAFLLLAFMTTFIATLTVFASPASLNSPTVVANSTLSESLSSPTPNPLQGQITNKGVAGSGNTDIARILGVLTTAAGAIATFYGTLNSRRRPQKEWYRNRRISEELRKHYFLYLAHLPPFDTGDRYRNLRPTIGKISELE